MKLYVGIECLFNCWLSAMLFLLVDISHYDALLCYTSFQAFKAIEQMADCHILHWLAALVN